MSRGDLNIMNPEIRHPLAEWVAARCTVGCGVEALVGALYASYVAWCHETGRPPMPVQPFGVILNATPGLRPYWSRRFGPKRARALRGIALRDAFAAGLAALEE